MKKIYEVAISDYKGGEIKSLTEYKSLEDYMLSTVLEKIEDLGLSTKEEVEEYLKNEFLDFDEYDNYAGYNGSSVRIFDAKLNEIDLDSNNLSDFVDDNIKLILSKLNFDSE